VPLYAYRDRPFSEAVAAICARSAITAELRFLQWTALRPIVQQEGKAVMAQLTWARRASSTPRPRSAIISRARATTTRAIRAQGLAGRRRFDDRCRPAQELYRKALRKIADEAYFVPISPTADLHVQQRARLYGDAGRARAFLPGKWK